MKSLMIATLLLISAGAMAQTRIGIKGGLNFADQYRKDAGAGKYSTKIHTELQAGIISDIRLGKKLFLQPQLAYARKGGTHVSKLPGQNVKVKMNYAELPVNLVYKKEHGSITYFAGAGPMVGYGFGGELVQGGESKDLYSDAVKNFSHWDAGANAVVGLELKNGLFASVSYTHGLRDIYKTDAVTIRNRTLGVSVGYYLPNKKKRTS